MTFVASTLERVIEEQARGDPAKAVAVRREIVAVIGDNLSKIRPGSPEAAQVKEALIRQGAWSQYLEVGIGPDAEIFTKSQPMSAVGLGAEVGIHPKSEWNNPEPEIVLAVNGKGRTVGAALGNDVNLRDFEGRSALLLGKAKDNNASCAIGPFIRLFDEHFGIDDVRRCDIAMRVDGPEGFEMTGLQLDGDDQPRSARPRGSRDRRQPPVSRRADAVPGHDVRAGQGPPGAGQGLHARRRRRRHRDHADARRARQPRQSFRQSRTVDLRRRRADAKPRAPASPLAKLDHIMAEMFRNYIAGEWVAGASATANRNPSDTSDVIGEYAQADAEQARNAIAAAKKAFPAWSTGSIQERANILDRAGSEIIARKDELGALLSREEGKTLPEGIGEAMRAGQIFKFFAGEVVRMTGDKLASVRPGVDVEVTREPLGVIGLITPWNFPIAIPAWKIAPALAYGNTVVCKPADLVPGCAWAIAEILARAGLPAGVFNLVMGRGSVVGEVIVNHPDVTAISFTGSVAPAARLPPRPSRAWPRSSSKWAARIR